MEMSMFGCTHESCTRHPSKGDLIVRTSPKGQPFEGLCREHLTEDQEVPDGTPDAG